MAEAIGANCHQKIHNFPRDWSAYLCGGIAPGVFRSGCLNRPYYHNQPFSGYNHRTGGSCQTSPPKLGGYYAGDLLGLTSPSENREAE